MAKNVRNQNNPINSDRKKWGTLAVLLFAYFAPNYMHYQVSPVSQEIMRAYSITPAMFSKIFSAPMIPAVFLSLISGMLTDKYGAKPVIGTGLVLTAAGSILRFFGSTYSLLFCGMMLIGVTGAFINANGVKVLSRDFPAEKISFFTGVLLASATIAMTLATGTTSLFPSLRSVYMTGMIIGIIAVILWFLFAENTVPGHQTVSDVSMLASVKDVSHAPTVWLASASLFFIMACLIGTGSFLPLALSGRGMSSVAAGTYTAVFTAGNLVGSFASPALDQFWKHTRAQILIMIALIGTCTAFAWCTPTGLPLFLILLLNGICIGGILPLLMSLPLRTGEVPAKNAGAAGGIISTVQLTGAIILPSYVIAPIAGDNLGLFFRIAGCLTIIPFLINLIAALRINRSRS